MPDFCHVTWTVGEGGAKTGAAVQGPPGPLPAVWLPFWKGNAVDVLDLGPRGLPGQGYWPYTAIKPPPGADEKLAGPDREIDATEMTVTDTWTVVAKSAAELSAERAPERDRIAALIQVDVAARKTRNAQRKLDRRVRSLEQS